MAVKLIMVESNQLNSTHYRKKILWKVRMQCVSGVRNFRDVEKRLSRLMDMIKMIHILKILMHKLKRIARTQKVKLRIILIQSKENLKTQLRWLNLKWIRVSGAQVWQMLAKNGMIKKPWRMDIMIQLKKSTSQSLQNLNGKPQSQRQAH